MRYGRKNLLLFNFYKNQNSENNTFKFKIYILSKHLNVLRNLTIQITEYQEVHNNMQYT